MIAWLKVFAIGIFGIIPAKFLALFVYPCLSADGKKNNPIWGIDDTTDFSYWNGAIRNSAHNLLNKPQTEYTTTGNTDDETLEKLEGFQWRYRKSVDGKYVSFRITWGKPDGSKGKKEFYIGWTMNETPSFGLSFVQLRAAWYEWIGGLTTIGVIYLIINTIT